MSDIKHQPVSVDADNQEEATKVESREIPVNFYLPENLTIQYADNFNVFFSDYDFTLTFMQTEAPLIINDEDWEQVESINAKGVVRVVVPPHLIPRIVDVLTNNWQRYIAAQRKRLQERHVNVTATTAGAQDSAAEADKS